MNAPRLRIKSVRGKLFAGALAASLVALLVAGASLFAYDLHTYRQASSTSLAIEAEVIGNASSAALQFEDRAVAAANLAMVRARPGLRVAAIYSPRGAVFASYVRPQVDRSEIPPLPGVEGVEIVGDRVTVFRRIVADSEIVGTVYLAEDLGTASRVTSYAAIALLVLLAALAVSALVSARIQKGIARPIDEIAALANQVVGARDYSVRARRTTDDEIGTLVDAFNAMLSEIEARTAALEASSAEVNALNRDLERRVSERTAQLEESNLRLRTADQAKSSFLSMMSHEIRTPMNGVLGMLELLSLTELDSQQRTTLGIVRDSGRSLLRIIDDILDFSKIEAGRLEVRPEVASVERVVSSVTAIYSGNASSKGLVLKSWCDPRLSPAVMVDPMRLQQILNNLVSNAVKFTSKGWVEIRAELAERREEVDFVRLTVADTGIGIPEAAQAALFQPFSQASGDVARSFGGTGLGLSIGRRLAELMNGTLTIASRPGHGTTATLLVPLPVADPALLPATGEEASRGDAKAVVRTRRSAPSVATAEAERTLVLVADDHPVNLMLITRQTRALGYACESAEDGRKALELWRSGRFGLLLTDCNMPEMDGYELAREIRVRERREGREPIVIIACTANALAGEAERCYAAGMNDYVAKPVELPKLAAKLDRWLPLPEATDAPSAPLEPPPIDRSVLAPLSAGDEEMEKQVVVEFARVNHDDVSRLGKAVQVGAAQEVVQAAHRIKGASRSVGAVAISDAAAAIERAAKAGDWAAIASGRAKLAREVERLDRHLRAAPGD
jgi:signal transduction histidine kinase/DNA-binding response OmpR family regulator